MMISRISLSILMFALLCGCAGARLSSAEARKQISGISTSPLVPQAIEIRRIVSQTDTRAIAETTVALTFQFEKDKTSNSWHVASIRMGDGDWVNLDEVVKALNEGRRRDTALSLEKLTAGIASFRSANGAAPAATDIVSLTNVLHPQYMRDLIRNDAWGRPIVYEVSAGGFRLISYGADGVRGTPDDIALPN